jgi:hypothetical protein
MRSLLTFNLVGVIMSRAKANLVFTFDTTPYDMGISRSAVRTIGLSLALRIMPPTGGR